MGLVPQKAVSVMIPAAAMSGSRAAPEGEAAALDGTDGAAVAATDAAADGAVDGTDDGAPVATPLGAVLAAPLLQAAMRSAAIGSNTAHRQRRVRSFDGVISSPPPISAVIPIPRDRSGSSTIGR
jgi:hypothetical protein